MNGLCIHAAHTHAFFYRRKRLDASPPPAAEPTKNTSTPRCVCVLVDVFFLLADGIASLKFASPLGSAATAAQCVRACGQYHAEPIAAQTYKIHTLIPTHTHISRPSQKHGEQTQNDSHANRLEGSRETNQRGGLSTHIYNGRAMKV